MTETLVALVIAVSTVTLLAAISQRANGRFKAEQRLPMQWWMDGSVTWTAPRPVALAFTPVLAALCLGAIVGLTVFGRTRPGQEHLVIPINVLIALFLLSFHAFHLWLMRRTFQRQR